MLPGQCQIQTTPISVVIWTNLNTSMMSNYTVPWNANSYIVTELSVNVNYNVSVAAIGVCGMMTSDPIAIKCEYVCMYTLLYFVWADQRVQQFYNCHNVSSR